MSARERVPDVGLELQRDATDGYDVENIVINDTKDLGLHPEKRA